MSISTQSNSIRNSSPLLPLPSSQSNRRFNQTHLGNPGYLILALNPRFLQGFPANRTPSLFFSPPNLTRPPLKQLTSRLIQQINRTHINKVDSFTQQKIAMPRTDYQLHRSKIKQKRRLTKNTNLTESELMECLEKDGIRVERPKNVPNTFEVKIVMTGTGLCYKDPRQIVCIRSMAGKGSSPNEHQRAPYVVHTIHGNYYGEDGKPVQPYSSGAHIKFDRYDFKKMPDYEKK